MGRVITFSRTFPVGHVNEGMMTDFPKHIWRFILANIPSNKLFTDPQLYNKKYYELFKEYLHNDSFNYSKYFFKSQTIRMGKRWQEGDVFKPVVWLGKPYMSKQFQFAPLMTVSKTFDFKIEVDGNNVCVFIDGNILYEEDGTYNTDIEPFKTLCANEGLTIEDFKSWFKWGKPFDGQIVCWDKDVIY